MDWLSSSIFRRATGRLLLALTLGTASGVALSIWLDWRTSVVGAWVTGSSCLLVMSWLLLARETPQQTQQRAAAEDPGRNLLHGIGLLSSAASLFAVVVAMRKVETLLVSHAALVLLSLLAAASAWLLVHTSYAQRYAHLYYRDDDDGVGGLAFPGNEPPGGLDFAYFSFTIGMCYQVSDVSIVSSRMRRTALAHGLLSFTFNTAILALTLNLVLGAL